MSLYIHSQLRRKKRVTYAGIAHVSIGDRVNKRWRLAFPLYSQPFLSDIGPSLLMMPCAWGNVMPWASLI